MMKWLAAVMVLVQFNVYAQTELPNSLDELDPRDPQIETILKHYDQDYLQATGESPFLEEGQLKKGNCYRNACPVWARVSLDEQMLYLYVDGAVKYVWPVSSGKKGYGTPDFDQNPNGRIYDQYTSISFPGGDYNGLGNMPYAVFIQGGYAIHGTTKGNWPLLGKKASHGCIRLHPDNAFIFNRMVRASGVGSVWITVE